MELHPEILSKGGKPEFAVLPYDEYLELQKILADAQDLIDLREAKALDTKEPSVGLQEAKKILGI